MYRCLFLTVAGLLLCVLPVAAADPEAVLFSDDAALFLEAETPLVNGPFLAISARQALRKPTKHHLVIAGDEAKTDPQEVSINSLTIKPGAKLPSSVREITIVGGKTANVTVTGRAPSK